MAADNRDEDGVPKCKSSLSGTFTKITTNRFNRRQTTTLLQDVTSQTNEKHPSRIPTPSGIPRSTSFFSSRGAFSSKTTPVSDASERSEHPASKPSRKISERLAQTPFLNHQHQRVNTTPFFNRQKRESSVQIEQHALMTPLHPPLPRSSTMGNLGHGHNAQDSPGTPSFMRSTSSSARRSSLATPKQHTTPMPTISASKTPTSGRRAPSSGNAADKTPKSQHRLITRPASIEIDLPSTGTEAPNNTPTSITHTTLDRSKTPAYHRPVELSNPSGRGSSFMPVPGQSSLRFAPTNLVNEDLTFPPSPPASEHGGNNTQGAPGLLHHVHPAGITQDTSSEDSDGTAGNLSHLGLSGYQANQESMDMPNSGESTSSIDLKADYAKPTYGPERPPVKDSDAKAFSGQERQANTPDMSNPRLVHTALHNLEWAGRFTSLSDRFRTTALPSSSPVAGSSSSPASSTNSLTSSLAEPMNDESRRKARIYTHLHSLCTTDEARESLAAFKIFMEERDARMSGGVKGAKIKDKHGFFQALIGKKK